MKCVRLFLWMLELTRARPGASLQSHLRDARYQLILIMDVSACAPAGSRPAGGTGENIYYQYRLVSRGAQRKCERCCLLFSLFLQNEALCNYSLGVNTSTEFGYRTKAIY